MYRVQHRWHVAAIKCTFTVINIILFTAQLSYKFYLFANQPSPELRGTVSIHTSVFPGDPASPNFDGRQLLSLDKRYSFKNIFSLPIPSYRNLHLSLTVKRQFYSFQDTLTDRPGLLLSSRSPPVA